MDRKRKSLIATIAASLMCGALCGQILAQTPLFPGGGAWSLRASSYLGGIGLACVMLGAGMLLSAPLAWGLSLLLRNRGLRKEGFEIKTAITQLLVGLVLSGWYLWSTLEYEAPMDAQSGGCGICTVLSVVSSLLH